MASIKAPPTFSAEVEIPLAGGSTEKVRFEFKHRTVDELIAWEKDNIENKRQNREVVADCVVGWAFVEPFTAENLDVLLNNYHGASRAIVRTYLRELGALRLGN